jgi:hypothetical protein
LFFLFFFLVTTAHSFSFISLDLLRTLILQFFTHCNLFLINLNIIFFIIVIYNKLILFLLFLFIFFKLIEKLIQLALFLCKFKHY